MEAEAGDGGLGDLLLASSTELNADGFALLERFEREIKPSTAVEKLPDWEAAFRMSTTPAALYGGTAARQAQVVARWREHGQSSLPNIAAALAAVCGYVPAILEHDRAALTTLQTVTSPGGGTISASGDTSRGFDCSDNAPCSHGGARVSFTVTHPHIEDLAVRLTAPSGAFKTWAAGTWAGITGAVTAQAFSLVSALFAGENIDGSWELRITNAGASTGTLSLCGLFVEGIGRAAPASHVEGMAANVFEWGVAIREASCGPGYDRETARALVQRWNPGHCRVDLALYQPEDDTLGMVVGGTNCIVGIAVVG